MQVVSQLELQLQKERDRLQSMMDHLNRARQQQQQQQQQQTKENQPSRPPVNGSFGSASIPPVPNSSLGTDAHRMSPSLAALVSATMRGAMSLPLHPHGPNGHPHPSLLTPPPAPPRRRLSEKPNLPSNAGECRVAAPNSGFRPASVFFLFEFATLLCCVC
jgi:hypothetical protein